MTDAEHYALRALPPEQRRRYAATLAAKRRADLTLYLDVYAERFGRTPAPAATRRRLDEDPYLIELEVLAAA